MSNYFLSKDDINNNVLVSDFLIGMGSTLFGQEGNIRQFLAYPPGKDDYSVVIVNMDRNEWFTTNPDMEGKVTDLAEKLFAMPFDYKTIAAIVKASANIYAQPRPSSLMFDPTEKVQVAMDVDLVDDNSILTPLYVMGITQSVAFKYMKQGTYTGIQDGKEHHALLFPNSNGGYYSMHHKGWRTVGEDGISLIGPKSDSQRLCVFYNPLDFLAIQQKRHSLGTDVFFSNDRFLIINGKKNIDDALGHVATHPEYYNVCCFYPITDEGVALFAKFHDICQGTDIDSTRLYNGYTTYADKLDHDTWVRREDGLKVVNGIVNSFMKKEAEAKAAKERQAQAEAAKQQPQAPAAERQQPEVRHVSPKPTVRDTTKQKSEVAPKAPKAQKAATDDEKPKRGFRL